jgi:hypothetical protein
MAHKLPILAKPAPNSVAVRQVTIIANLAQRLALGNASANFVGNHLSKGQFEKFDFSDWRISLQDFF